MDSCRAGGTAGQRAIIWWTKKNWKMRNLSADKVKKENKYFDKTITQSATNRPTNLPSHWLTVMRLAMVTLEIVQVDCDVMILWNICQSGVLRTYFAFVGLWKAEDNFHFLLSMYFLMFSLLDTFSTRALISGKSAATSQLKTSRSCVAMSYTIMSASDSWNIDTNSEKLSLHITYTRTRTRTHTHTVRRPQRIT